jgi:hypothetical protein
MTREGETTPTPDLNPKTRLKMQHLKAITTAQ